MTKQLDKRWPQDRPVYDNAHSSVTGVGTKVDDGASETLIGHAGHCNQQVERELFPPGTAVAANSNGYFRLTIPGLESVGVLWVEPFVVGPADHAKAIGDQRVQTSENEPVIFPNVFVEIDQALEVMVAVAKKTGVLN